MFGRQRQVRPGAERYVQRLEHPRSAGRERQLQQALAEQRQAEANEQRYRELVETGDMRDDHLRAIPHHPRYGTGRNQQAPSRARCGGKHGKTEQPGDQEREAAVEAAQNQVGTSEQAIADTVVRAPFAGFISDRPRRSGEYVSSASIVATILRTNPIKVQIQIAEADVP